jgi:hypothetical protein
MDCRYVSSTPNDRRCFSPTKITMSPPLTRRSNKDDICCTALVRLWHTASICCGAKVRTRSERSGHAESVGSGSI